ncbi:hypothetical protein MA16_Dca004967 [Dendrobium catenatum]|uniref:Uncharacterized protein n=1 Tax=Dendrobium catenatum TaxID=906689 RepID=A0A2I0WGI6_9ASPA|nr:hypothetical protein MA16_Dca004967 [Dendrobium catenatum]
MGWRSPDVREGGRGRKKCVRERGYLQSKRTPVATPDQSFRSDRKWKAAREKEKMGIVRTARAH